MAEQDYFTSACIRDRYIKSEVTSADIERTNDIYEDLVFSMGLELTEVQIDPLPFRVENHLIYVCQRDICEDKMANPNQRNVRNNETENVWHTKYKHNNKRARETEGEMTIEVLKGITSDPGGYSNKTFTWSRA